MTDPAELAGLLTAWLPSRRWYVTKNRRPEIESVVVNPAAGMRARQLAASGTDILETFVTDRTGPEERTVYQVPIVRREARPPLAAVREDAVIGRDSAGRWLIDAPADLDYVTWLLRGDDGGIPLSDAEVVEGEQSNTSVICSVPEGPADVIVKIFRVLAAGSNPDVELQQALSEAGTARVPRFVDAQWGSWTRGGDQEYGHLSVTSEYLRGALDAWRIATRALGAGEDIDAAAIGRAVAEVHQILGRVFPTAETTSGVRQHMAAGWRRRARLASGAVPELTPLLPEISALLDAAESGDWPPLQRIHGDLHLGQVMSSADRGWVLIDFEGEPLRPLAERREPDLALRDVAGMLRSFDYAAGADPGAAESTWAARHREAFLDGYSAVAGDPRERPGLLAALELDKALYEARYETGNRPEWLPIPLRGVERLLAAAPHHK